MPASCSAIATRPVVTCSPVATTVSYSRGVVQRGERLAPGDELVGDAGHGGDHDGDLVPGLDLAPDAGGDVADAVEIGDGGAAELHDDASHLGLDAPGVGCESGGADILSETRTSNMARALQSSVSAEEVARFDALAGQWWDRRGRCGRCTR